MLAFLQGDLIPKIPLDKWTERFVKSVTSNDTIDNFFDGIRAAIDVLVKGFEAALTAPPELLMVAIFAVIAFFLSGWRVALFSVLGFVLIIGLGLWEDSMLTLALVLASTLVALAIGIPLGIISAKSRVFEAAARPTLDVMQTLPAFVYLVPMVVFLGLGSGPALVSTVIFAAPPAVRLTMLGIQQVPKNTVEAAQAFGATPWQTLRKVELPQALPTIMAGVNQVIMLALSMVVIAALVGSGGLGQVVVRGLSQLNVGLAFVGGVGIVIIAIYLDRVTKNLGRRKALGKRGKGISKLLSRTKSSPDSQADDAEGDAEEAGTEAGVGAGTRW
jgi:glycine betaine/proline transport system permease protein